MNNHAKLLLGTVGALALCVGSATASNFHGWYVGLEGGANVVQDWNHNQAFTLGGAVTTTAPAQSSFDTGWAGLATVGYAFHNWRLEVEGGYRHNNQDLVTATPVGFSTNTGHLSTWSVMGNVLYDIPLTNRFSLTLGAGAGGANSHLEYFTPGPNNTDDNWKFAYQGIAGINYAIGSRTELFLDYRYFRVVDPDFNFRGPGSNFLINNADDLVNHTATIGLRFALSPQEEAAPPPPPLPPEAPPAPPPPEVKHFIIFFGFNKCNITGEADSVLSQAAATAKNSGAASISIVGHTDTVGSDKYNQKLSLCRANAARTNLIGKGVPDGAITVTGKGETELMVQTGDNVKEPQNRRATVDLH